MMSFISYKAMKPFTISYVERGNNMYEVVKFVYLMIIILSPFHVAMNYERKQFLFFSNFFS